jgi:hypothetical protein
VPLFDFFDPLENSDFPNICKLSGRSALIDMPATDFLEACLDNPDSDDFEPVSDPKDEVVLVLVFVLE